MTNPIPGLAQFAVESFGFCLSPNKAFDGPGFAERIAATYDVREPRTKEVVTFLANRKDLTFIHQHCAFVVRRNTTH